MEVIHRDDVVIAKKIAEIVARNPRGTRYTIEEHPTSVTARTIDDAFVILNLAELQTGRTE